MSFTYDITTDTGKVRLLIDDKVSTYDTPAHFSDAEIDAFLTMASSVVRLAAVYALESWAAALSSEVSSEKIGDYSYSTKQSANKLALAEKYRAEVDASNDAPVLEWAEMDLTGEDE